MRDSLKQDESTMLYGAWKAKPGKQTLTPLLTHLDPVINKALSAYGYGDDRNMRNTARVLAIKALPKFDPERASLDTFVFGELRRLQREGPKQEFAVAIPERVMLDRATLNRSVGELRESLGRDPTDDEVVDATGISQKRLRTIRGVVAQNVGPQLDEKGDVVTAGVDDVPDGRALWEEAVTSSFGPIDKKIYEWSTGVGGIRLSKTQIAQRLRLSPAAITQRSARIVARLSEGEGMQI